MVMGSIRQEAEVAVIGAGPGGYVAALRLADLGKEVLLIEERDQPGSRTRTRGVPRRASPRRFDNLIGRFRLRQPPHREGPLRFCRFPLTW